MASPLYNNVADAAATTAAAPLPAYDDYLFATLLRHANPSRVRVEAIAHVALHYLPYAANIWAALRSALMAQHDASSDHCRALWYVTDALLKHAPHVYVPLVTPRLLELVIQHMPWRQVRWGSASAATATTTASAHEQRAGGGAAVVWCEALVRTWRDVLPRALYDAMEQHAVLCCSEAQLSGLLTAATHNDDDSNKKSVSKPRNEGADASEGNMSMHSLREEWDSLRYWCASYVHEATATAVVHRRDGGDAGNNNDDNNTDGNEAAAAALARLLSTSTTDARDDAAAAPPPPPSTLHAANGKDVSDDKQKQQRSKHDDNNGDDDDDDDDDEEYAPDFLPGAIPRALPKLDLPAQRRRRDARRRAREDDDL